MSPLTELIKLLNIEQIETNLFRGFHPEGRRRRLFGGQVIAQALMAATRTVPEDRAVHSVHAYFLRPGDPTVPALYDVERIRDGASFTTRRIVAIQHGKAIFNMDASFQIEEEGLTHQAPMADFIPPDIDQISEGLKTRPFVSFRENHKEKLAEIPQEPVQHIWTRSNGSVADDPVLHTALLAYQSDDALLGTARLPHRGGFKRDKMQVASLDHSIWFHRPARVDQWLLYSLDSPTAAEARGFTRGTVHTADGVLVASCIQEGLIRLWEEDNT